ncbi:MAG: hypothetical protein IJ558_01560 [Treponema sp.]|nr:hypothetical protein [Treponema sp.]
MRKIFFAILVIFSFVLLNSCSSTSDISGTGKLVYYDENTTIVDTNASLYGDKWFVEAAKSHGIFIEDTVNDDWNPNVIITNDLLSNFSKAKKFKTGSSKQAVIDFLQENYGFDKEVGSSKSPIIKHFDNCYIYTFKDNLWRVLCAKIKIDDEKIKNYKSSLEEWRKLNDEYADVQKEISRYQNPNIELSRVVTYVESEIRFDRNNNMYREPVNKYRTETYLAVNPDYDPAKAEKIRNENAGLAESLSRAEEKLKNARNFYTVTFY